MRILLPTVAMMFSAFIHSPLAHAKDAAVKDLIPSYVAIQEALAADDFSAAQAKASDLKNQTQNSTSQEIKAIHSSLVSFQKTKSLSDARKEFKKLSSPFVKWIESSKDSEYESVYCPMAGAKWVQKKGEVTNPFYGKEMLHCGEKSS